MMSIKSFLFLYFFTLLLFSCQGVADDAINVEEEAEPFVPTNEWQTIKPNQAIPKGLHVRVNLQTGLKEAKLLSEKENEKKDTGSLLVIPNEDTSSAPSDDGKLDRASLKKALHKMKPDDVVSLDEEAKEAASKYRSYDELKKEFAALNLTMKTDLEIMAGLFESYEKLLIMYSKVSEPSLVVESMVTVLTDLEYLVHQIDNAKEFVKSNGFSKIILPSFNITSPTVRTEVMKLLGSATQSNAQVQIAALEAGAVNLLLRTFALEREHKVRSSALYALSCLVRRFPTAQLELTKQGGVAVLTSLFEEHAESETNLKLQLKIITLIHDLIAEKQFAAKDVEGIADSTDFNSTDEKLLAELEEKKERLRQYNSVDLENKLIGHGWCNHLSQILMEQSSVTTDRTERRDDLSSAIADLPVRFEHDVIEKILECFAVLSSKCHKQFRDNEKLHLTLKHLSSWYSNLASKEINSDSDYYTNLSNLVNELMVRLNVNDVSVFTAFPKDEL
nr:PREDICTED: nucleotide exchange factor SIL1 [Bemisia tabaci]